MTAKLVLLKSKVDGRWVSHRSDNAEIMEIQFNHPLTFRPDSILARGLNGDFIYTDTSIEIGTTNEVLELRRFPKYRFTFDSGKLISIIDISGDDEETLDRLELPFDAPIIRFISVIKEYASDIHIRPVE